jgi:hypothetical protein
MKDGLASGKSRRRAVKVELPPPPRGNCYVTSEALYWILGGKAAGWKPMHMRLDDGESHWFLQHETGLRVDPTRLQFLFDGTPKPDYSKARGKGFLTTKASKRTIEMMLAMTYGVRFAMGAELEAEFRRGATHGFQRG